MNAINANHAFYHIDNLISIVYQNEIRTYSLKDYQVYQKDQIMIAQIILSVSDYHHNMIYIISIIILNSFYYEELKFISINEMRK